MIFDIIKQAKQLLFDNAKSGLKATNAQDAIDELSKNIISNHNNGRIGIQAYNGDYAGTRLQSSSTDDPNPSINLYLKHDKSDPSFERALTIFFDGTDFCGIGKTKDGETVRKTLSNNSIGNLASIVTSDYCTIGFCTYEKNGGVIVLSINITTNSEVPVNGVLLDNIPLRPNVNGLQVPIYKYGAKASYMAGLYRTADTKINRILMYDSIPSGTAIRTEIVFTGALYQTEF